MKLAIMQPYFFPYLGYFQLIHAVDKFILYDNLNYIKYGWVNRNRVPINQAPRFFIVPVSNKSSYQKIRDIRIDPDSIWKKKFLKLVFYTYRRAPYFEEVYALVEQIVGVEHDRLAALNAAAVRALAGFLDIRAAIVSDVSHYEWLEEELEAETSETNSFYLRTQGLSDTKTIRVLCICRAERADTFVNAIGGQALYDKAIFGRNAIDLHFVKTLPHSYEQGPHEFIPGMSIIDVLMHCGRAGTRRLLDRYELV
jgi:hypothetical protein